jgi:hypothetical protein
LGVAINGVSVKIESYVFGEIVIEGRTYRSDVLVFRDRVSSGWWRIEGHRLASEDLREILDSDPEVIVVGTGCYGRMAIPRELVEELGKEGIELLAYDSQKACEMFNKISADKRTVAAIHLTC